LLTLGLLTPLAAAAIIGVMAAATLSVHVAKGLWNTNGGYEFPLVMAASAAAVAIAGPGRYSLDALFGWDLDGLAWGVGAVALGLVAGTLVYATSKRSAAASARRERERLAEEERPAA
jgi:putative oxidoreductase